MERRKGIPLLVFANKQDIEGAMTPKEVEDALNLHNMKDRLYRKLAIHWINLFTLGYACCSPIDSCILFLSPFQMLKDVVL